MTKKIILVALIAVFFIGLECGEPVPVEVTVTASEDTDSNDILYAKFSYTFNQDVTLDSIKVILPGFTDWTDVPNDSGDMEGDTEYDFPVYWQDGGEDVVIKGDYSVRFWGTAAKTDEPFELTKEEVTL